MSADTLLWTLLLAAVVAAAAVTVTVLYRRGGDPLPSPGAVGTALGAALTALALGAAGGGTALDQAAAQDTGATRTVEVVLGDMAISPATVAVDAGDTLVLQVRNDDDQAHDLVLDTGARTPRLEPGQSATLRVGTVTAAVEGWCTVMGHGAAGMRMRIDTAGPTADAPAPADAGGAPPAPLNLSGEMSGDWRPRDAALPPAPGGTEHEVEIRVAETEMEVAPGVRQNVWTFNGDVPGPVLRGRVGDVFTVTFVNDGTTGHGIDFHAGSLAPDEPMRTIQPGERLTYRFRAEKAGAWLYHCSTAPMSQHIGNGMYGAVVVDPPGLEPVDREYLLVQGELYLGEPGSAEQVARMRAGEPDAWVFNGVAAGYDHAPLTAKAGERVRIWVVAAGPTSGTSFHVVGAQFDAVYKEGAHLLRPGDDGGAQSLDLAVAQGGFVETVFPEAGSYPFVDHDMRHAENGARGFFEITE
ncbi:multicopper oxidase domain-containing protein [Thermobifida alba]|uniref:Copper-containing nitrite reductase n=1 Tax=Thermobifida alba TaxID=53522 RepID=A0ABY4L313_THEAE|nr:multicopper oxidase domain-containing protein [Thermobifida alba]UPT22048.1 multicopper oxidase domain-containing protein [Thermobifida alba]